MIKKLIFGIALVDAKQRKLKNIKEGKIEKLWKTFLPLKIKLYGLGQNDVR